MSFRDGWVGGSALIVTPNKQIPDPPHHRPGLRHLRTRTLANGSELWRAALSLHSATSQRLVTVRRGRLKFLDVSAPHAARSDQRHVRTNGRVDRHELE